MQWLNDMRHFNTLDWIRPTPTCDYIESLPFSEIIMSVYVLVYASVVHKIRHFTKTFLQMDSFWLMKALTINMLVEFARKQEGGKKVCLLSKAANICISPYATGN